MHLENSETTMERNAGSLRRTVADALTQESSLRMAESIRTYASQSRANGDSIHEVLEVLMELARETTPPNASSAKRSCDVAEWAIAGYYDERESIRDVLWRARETRKTDRERSS